MTSPWTKKGAKNTVRTANNKDLHEQKTTLRILKNTKLTLGLKVNVKVLYARTRAPLPHAYAPTARTDSQATGPLPQAPRNFQRCGGPQRNADSVAAGRNGQGLRDRDRYRSLTLDCCRPHHTIAHVWARLPGAAISRGTHSRPSRRHLLQASSKSAPHATLALWHARHARFCGSLSSEGQSRPNRHEQRELI